jgi:hypothetical protein
LHNEADVADQRLVEDGTDETRDRGSRDLSAEPLREGFLVLPVFPQPPPHPRTLGVDVRRAT